MGVKKILDYIYPPRCPVCDRISAKGICDVCRKQLVFIYEDYCLKCGKPLTDERQELCADCKRRVHFFEEGRSLVSYQGPMRLSLYRLKYANRREYADVYGREMADAFGRWMRARGITLIVPVPLHPTRRRERGYNQAALLARELGRRTGILVEERLLYRVKKTVALKKLSGQERRKALRNAFALSGPVRRCERILLVDDIYTTGNTVDAAAACLKRGGGKAVYVLTVAIGG